MAELPDRVINAWDNRKGPVSFATVSPEGEVNIIYVTCVKRYGRDRLVIADNYFNKTRANIRAGSGGRCCFRIRPRLRIRSRGPSGI
jgi:predicted pyridoxine 5'-phosphate oxidase superfamily flavin-nucleotide-binding protein